jgi:hypothetical protein
MWNAQKAEKQAGQFYFAKSITNSDICVISQGEYMVLHLHFVKLITDIKS